MPRIDGRQADQLRSVTIETRVQMHAEGSVVIGFGDTRVLCAVSIEDGVPGFLRGTGAGWVTAEYGMLPRSTNTRSRRERNRTSGRTQEIQRLIGRSLRAVTNLDILGERTFTVDCDVLQADGGTRTAAVTGGYVALYLAMQGLVEAKKLSAVPLNAAVAAVSVGHVEDEILLDLCYAEDSAANVDLNVVATSEGAYVEVQGTAEGEPFPRATLDDMLSSADAGLRHLFEVQQSALGTADAP